ncbi:hypothetical protein MRX96_030422 [Rhipicephalus microplus]
MSQCRRLASHQPTVSLLCRPTTRDTIAALEVGKVKKAEIAGSKIAGALERTPKVAVGRPLLKRARPERVSNELRAPRASVGPRGLVVKRVAGGRKAAVNRWSWCRERTSYVTLCTCAWGQPFPSDDDAKNAAAAAEADPKRASTAGVDNVIAYVMSMNVDDPGLNIKSNAATVENTAGQAELIKEKAVLNAVLTDIMECLKLHSSRCVKAEEDEEEVRNSLAKAWKKRTEKSSKGELKRKSNPGDNRRSGGEESEARQLDVPMGELSQLHAQRHNQFQKKQTVEPHYPLAVTGKVKARNSLESKEGDCVVDEKPERPAVVTEVRQFEDEHQKRSRDVTGCTARQRYEAPLVFFSRSCANSSEQGSSGLHGGLRDHEGR